MSDSKFSILFHHADADGYFVDTRYIGTMKQLSHEFGLLMSLMLSRQQVERMTPSDLVKLLNDKMKKVAGKTQNSFTLEDMVPEISEDRQTYIIFRTHNGRQTKMYNGTLSELKEQFGKMIKRCAAADPSINANPETIEDLIDTLIDCTVTEGRYGDYYELFKHVNLNAELIQTINTNKCQINTSR